jgi:competence protein ComEC
MGNRPCLKAAFLLAAGILLAWWFRIEIRGLFWCACVLTGLAFATSRRNAIARLRIGQVPVVAAFILAGAFRYSQETRLLPPDHVSRIMISSLRGPRVLVKGTLVTDPAQKPNRTEIIIEADSLGIHSPLSPARGKVLIPLKGLTACPLKYGDRILATGILTSPAGARNPGGFDYREWLARQGILAVLRTGSMDRILLIRRGCGNAFFRTLVYPVRRFALAFMDSTVRDESARSLVRALTLGDQGMIPQEVREDFSRTGAVHILSVSGSHVGFMYLILSVLFGAARFPAGLNAAATAAGLVFYALLTEASAPVVRATLMALALLAGSRMERKTDPYNTLGFAGLCILSWKPQNLFDVGFQLSFLSVFSIAYVYERLKTLFPGRASCHRARAPAWTKTLIAAGTVSIAAQIGTAPVTAYYFNWIPLVSVPANIIAVPLSGLIMAVSFTGLIIAPLHFGTASVYGALNGMLLDLFIKALHAIEKIPCSCLTIPSPSAVEMVLLYGMVLLLLNLRNASVAGKAMWVILLSANLGLWTHVAQNRSGRLRWIQFDVGQGDAALFQTPRGKTLLIDAGPKTETFDCGDKTIAPYLRRNGIRGLDAIIITHSHDDHAGGAEALIRRFKIGEIVIPAGPDTSAAFPGLLESARSRRIPVRFVRACDSLSVFGEVKVWVFNPLGCSASSGSGGSNELSLVTMIAFGNTRWISMGDAGIEAETRLAASLQWDRCDALKIGHHGSRSSSSPAFLAKVRPGCAVIPVGENNRFGHPDAVVLERLRLLGSRIHRTDLERAVILESDGRRTRKIEW